MNNHAHCERMRTQIEYLIYLHVAPAFGGQIVVFCAGFALGVFTLTAEFAPQTFAESAPSSSSPHVPPRFEDGV